MTKRVKAEKKKQYSSEEINNRFFPNEQKRVPVSLMKDPRCAGAFLAAQALERIKL